MPARDGAIGVPEQRSVVMGMQVDIARNDEQTIRIDYVGSAMLLELAYLRDTTVFYPDVGAEARHPGPVDNRTASNDGVEFGHGHWILYVRWAIHSRCVLVCQTPYANRYALYELMYSICG